MIELNEEMFVKVLKRTVKRLVKEDLDKLFALLENIDDPEFFVDLYYLSTYLSVYCEKRLSQKPPVRTEVEGSEHMEAY